MARFETSLEIDRPVEEIFAFMVRFENRTKWQTGLWEPALTTKGPLGVGTRTSEVRRFLGRSFETTGEITEYEPNRMVSWKSISAPMPLRGGGRVIRYEPIDGGTRINFVLEGEHAGLFKLADQMVGCTFRRQVETDFSILKDLLESQA